jgi:TetR/AcrR family acrAB operon transcriptional repressor
MARSTKEAALETRGRILDAAEDVFHRQGVADTSLDDVAQAADVTRGAIYWHFKNKNDLFTAMCERARLPMEAMIEANADERERDPLGHMRKTCIFILQDTVRNHHSRKVRDIIFHKCEFVDPADPIFMRQQECVSQGVANIEHNLRSAIARGQLASDLDIRLAALHLHAAITGLLNNWLFAPESFDLAADAERLVDSCLDAVRYAASLRN